MSQLFEQLEDRLMFDAVPADANGGNGNTQALDTPIDEPSQVLLATDFQQESPSASSREVESTVQGFSLLAAPPNSPPVDDDETDSTLEDTTLIRNAANGLLANASDVDGNTLTITRYSVVGYVNPILAGNSRSIANVGTVTIYADGSYQFVPVANFNGNVPVITYTVSDGNGGTDTSTLKIAVVAVNDTPTMTNPASFSLQEDSTIVLNGIQFQDVDSSNGSTRAIFSVSSGLLFFNWPITGLLTITGNGTSNVTIQGLRGTINSAITSGYLVYQPNANYNGTVQLSVIFNDRGNTGIDPGLTGDATSEEVLNTIPIIVTPVNDIPVDDNESESTLEDTNLVRNAANGLLSNASDIDGDILTITSFTVAGDPAIILAGTAKTITGVGTITINANGSYQFNPAANYNGNVPKITYTVSDGNGGIISSTLDIYIIPVNDPPVDGDESESTLEDTNLIRDAANGLLSNASDVDNDSLSIVSFTIAGDPEIVIAGASKSISGIGTITIYSDGSFEFVPVANFNGSVPTITYTVLDGHGGSDSSILDIDVIPVNDPPVGKDESESTLEDTNLIRDAANGLLANASDVDNDSLSVTSFTIAGDPEIFLAGASKSISGIGSITIYSNGSYEFVPVANFNGNVPEITYTISDGHGGSDTSILALYIIPVNDPPADGDESESTLEDTNLIRNAADGLLANAGDVDNDALTIVSFTIAGDPDIVLAGTSKSISGIGTITINPDGSYQFVPIANYNGNVPTITYTVSDGHGGSASAILEIYVTPVNDPPIAQADSRGTRFSDSISIAVLENDIDVDGDALWVAAIEGHPIQAGDSIVLTSGAIVTLNADGTITYNPNGVYDSLGMGQSAIEQFRYTVTDGTESSEAVVTINIAGLNTPPVAKGDSVLTNINTPVTVAVLENDFDSDGDSLSVTITSVSAGGTAHVNPNGSITVVPQNGFIGMISVHYLAKDPSGASSSAELVVQVKPFYTWDSYHNFSISFENQFFNSPSNRFKAGGLTAEILTLASDPIVTGFARPGTEIVGRMISDTGELAIEVTGKSDSGGNWLLQFHGALRFKHYRIEIDTIRESHDLYGYIGLSGSDTDYQSMQLLHRGVLRPQGYSAISNSPDSMLRESSRMANDPLGLGR